MLMPDRSLLLLLGLVACVSTPPPPERVAEAPAGSEAPAAPTSPGPAKDPAAAAAPPPQPLAGSSAFFILDLAGSSRVPAAEICDSEAACAPLVPGEDGQVRRNFDEESWLVITSPGNHAVAVVSDGATASVTLTPRCPADEDARGPRIVLYRVAKSVTAAMVRAEPGPKGCAKAP